MPAALDLIGLEVECTEVHQRDVASAFPGRRDGNNQNESIWWLEHDASVEKDGFLVAIRENRYITIMPPIPNSLNGKLMYSTSTLGTEVVCNPPFSIEQGMDEIKRKLTNLFEVLNYLGEPPQGTRNSIHIHISCPNSLKINKTILRLGRFMESLFFAIGTQGYTFRGELANSSAYCRPITKCGPPCTRVERGRYAQVLAIDDLLLSSTLSDFWKRYGNTIPNNPERYHPVRYTWLNLYSLVTHGSLEFRVFNYTNAIPLIMAEIALCQAFVTTVLSLAWSKDVSVLSLEENSVYDTPNKERLLEILRRFTEMSKSELLTEEVLSVLEDFILRSPPVVLPEEYIATHVPERSFNRPISYANLPYPVAIIPEREIVVPVVQDVHTLRGERR